MKLLVCTVKQFHEWNDEFDVQRDKGIVKQRSECFISGMWKRIWINHYWYSELSTDNIHSNTVVYFCSYRYKLRRDPKTSDYYLFRRKIKSVSLVGIIFGTNKRWRNPQTPGKVTGIPTRGKSNTGSVVC